MSQNKIKDYCIENEMLSVDLITNTLYKYVSIETAKLILQNTTLKFSTAEEFNDPFDLTSEGIDTTTTDRHINELVKRTYPGNRKARREFIKEHSHNKPVVEVIMKQQLENFRRSFGICCFSKKYDKTLMWSHYADKHCGICLGFKYFFTNHETLLMNVKYIDKLEKISYWEYREVIVPALVFKKSHVWEYEEEVRMVNVNRYGYFPFEKRCLTEIHYGLKTKKTDIQEINSLLSIHNYNPKEFIMKINPSTYDIIRINYE